MGQKVADGACFTVCRGKCGLSVYGEVPAENIPTCHDSLS